MSRAARKPKTKLELESMALEQLNAELDYLRTRKTIAGTSQVAKLFQKEIILVEQVRESNFGVSTQK